MILDNPRPLTMSSAQRTDLALASLTEVVLEPLAAPEPPSTI